jgi:hypothetical protein
MCTLGCPTGSGGDVDPACAAACPNPSSAEGIAAASALDACRTNDGALGCAACGRVPALLQQQCPPSTETAPCPVCEDNDCCDSYNACQGDPSCMQLKDCAKVCRDYACIYGCTLGAPSDAVVGYSSLLACLTMRCPVCTAGECSCWGTSCAPAYLACRTDAACSLWLFCVRSCSAGDTLCADRCAADQAADVATRFETLLDCSRSRCPECGL